MNEKEVQIYVYDKTNINRILSLLKTIRIEGYEQAEVLTEISRLVRSPLQEGTAKIGDEDEAE